MPRHHVVLLMRLMRSWHSQRVLFLLMQIATALAAEALQVATALALALHVVLLMLLVQLATALAAEALQQAEADAAEAEALQQAEPDGQVSESDERRHTPCPHSASSLLCSYVSGASRALGCNFSAAHVTTKVTRGVKCEVLPPTLLFCQSAYKLDVCIIHGSQAYL